MEKYMMIGCVGMLMMTAACAPNDEMVEPRATDSEINFYATAPKGARAVPTTTATLQSFRVSAFTNSSVIMDGVTVSRNGGVWSYSPIVYWPSEAVNFYALSPAETSGSTTIGPEGKSVQNVSCGSDDWLYAVSLNQHESPAPVPLTFRHAMSRVAVMLSSTNEQYDVEVHHVSLNNISLTGTFTLPHEETSHGTANALWSSLSEQARTLLYYDVSGTTVSLGVTPVDLTEGNLEMSYFVPQGLEPLQYESGKGFEGSYIQIDCVIKDKVTGKKIWPTAYTPDYLLVESTPCGRMVFPLATQTITSWIQGYSYIYNVVINHTYTLDTIQFEPVVQDYLVSTPY